MGEDRELKTVHRVTIKLGNELIQELPVRELDINRVTGNLAHDLMLAVTVWTHSTWWHTRGLEPLGKDSKYTVYFDGHKATPHFNRDGKYTEVVIEHK